MRVGNSFFSPILHALPGALCGKATRVFIIFTCCLFAKGGEFCAKAGTQDYIGANAVLQLVEAGAKSVAQTNDEQSLLRNDLKTFSENAASLAPADAARQWLALVDRAAKVQQQTGPNYNPSAQSIDGSALINALPPPVVWNELANAIALRPPAQDQPEHEMTGLGLHLLAATLLGDAAGRNEAITNLETKASGAGDQAVAYNQYLQQLSQTLLRTSDDPDAILKSLEQQVDSGNSGNMANLQMPNLIAQVGTEKAEAFLRKALVAPNVYFQFGEANETSRLAQKLALKMVDQLKAPHWELVNSLDAVDLYEALDKRFGSSTNNPAPLPGLPGLPVSINPPPPDFMDADQKSAAQIYYMLGLISEGRTQDAVAVAKKFKGSPENALNSTGFDAMDRAGYTDQLDDFLHELLSQDPTLPFWSQYVDVSADAGQTERMVALVRATLARAELNQNRKSALRQILYTALLAADNVDEGVQEMHRLMATNAPDNLNKGELGANLAQIGVLMKNPEWTEEGISAAKQWLASGQTASDWWQAENVMSSLSQTLVELNRGPEAEVILADALARATGVGASRRYDGNNAAQQILTTLAVLYYKAGRYDDVLDLLQNSPNWGAKDLNDLSDSCLWNKDLLSLHPGPASLPIDYVAAGALKAKGRTEEAERITDALLERQPASDRGYELLISLQGTNAIPRLDEIFSQDQFEPRPLIWKAYLLEQENQLEEAEKIIRNAIAIDPSDGQSGRGDRMRAYAVLADIRQARGDMKEADFYRQVVKAIRISEDADQYYNAGLLKRAVAMYQQGLDHFSDAYCIQSRMAIQLAALGKNDEAAEHYRRAYELMPDSFGRVESHCFGCERVFDGQRAQSIAEKIFTQLAAKEPHKAQVNYLLGYLYTEENHYHEAWTNFQAAVRLDPDYLNAWVQMQEVSEQILVSPEERDEIAYNLLRLDPLQRHSQPNFASVSNLARAWNAVAAAAKLQPRPVSDIFPLTASKIALEKDANNQGMPNFGSEMTESQQDQPLSPAGAISQTPYITLAGQLMLNESFNNGQ